MKFENHETSVLKVAAIILTSPMYIFGYIVGMVYKWVRMGVEDGQN
jgi:hypothetical protein